MSGGGKWVTSDMLEQQHLPPSLSLSLSLPHPHVFCHSTLLARECTLDCGRGIGHAIVADSPLVRIFAVLDRILSADHDALATCRSDLQRSALTAAMV